MMMLRATLFALALLSASAFKFVSQTFKGEHTDNNHGPATTHTVEIGLDMESVKLRSNHHMVNKIGETNMSFESKVSMIFDAEAKRVTTCHEIEIAAASPSPAPQCMYSEFPSLPAPAVVAKCLQDFVADAESTTSEDGLQKFQVPALAIPLEPYRAEAFVSTDDLFVMKKIVANLSSRGSTDVNSKTFRPDMTFHPEMTDVNSKAGAPDSSMFVVPTEWGTCTKMNPVFHGMDDINPVMRAFSHCIDGNHFFLCRFRSIVSALATKCLYISSETV